VTHFTIHVQRHEADGTVVWEAWHPALPGCRAQGVTPDEAGDRLAEARKLHLEALQAQGEPIPEGDTNLPYCLIWVH
jgi:predicted RNase H-like HicB family nuclease